MEYKVYNFDDEVWVASKVSYEDTLKFYIDNSSFDQNIENIEITECDLTEEVYCAEEDRYISFKEGIELMEYKEVIFEIACSDL
jgi:hypothetical protein